MDRKRRRYDSDEDNEDDNAEDQRQTTGQNDELAVSDDLLIQYGLLDEEVTTLPQENHTNRNSDGDDDEVDSVHGMETQIAGPSPAVAPVVYHTDNIRQQQRLVRAEIDVSTSERLKTLNATVGREHNEFREVDAVVQQLRELRQRSFSVAHSGSSSNVSNCATSSPSILEIMQLFRHGGGGGEEGGGDACPLFKTFGRAKPKLQESEEHSESSAATAVWSNRYSLRPGWRWDGVVRGTGAERFYFSAH